MLNSRHYNCEDIGFLMEPSFSTALKWLLKYLSACRTRQVTYPILMLLSMPANVGPADDSRVVSYYLLNV